MRARSAVLLLAAAVPSALAQPVFTVQAEDIIFGGFPDQLSDTQPVALDSGYGSVDYQLQATPGAVDGAGAYLGPDMTFVELTARSACDDYIITGPTGRVTATFHVRFTAVVQNSNTPGDIEVVFNAPSGPRFFRWAYEPGDSSVDSVVAFPPDSFELRAVPFSLDYAVVFGIGGFGETPAPFSIIAAATLIPDEVLALPEGYTLNSACAGVSNNALVSACPADLNGDGILDNGDIQAFVEVFLAGDLAADFNGDGILDNGDIQEFVALFLAGC